MRLCNECAARRKAQQSRRAHARERGLTLKQWAQQNCLLLKTLARMDERAVQVIKKPAPIARSPEEIAARVREQYRHRYRNDPEFALKERMRRQAKKHKVWGCIQSRIRDSAKREMPTGGALFEFLGYTPFDLKRHLERQFRDGMTWDAFRAGEIHIDHVIPVAQFDLTDDEEVRRCWALTNLQPLWAHENLAKGAKVGTLL